MEFSKAWLHCSDSPYGSALIFNEWHKARGWGGIGYHFVVGNGWTSPDMQAPWGALDGCIEAGRALDDDRDCESAEVGAHVYGFNSGSVGVVLVGKTKFTMMQLLHSRSLLIELSNRLGFPLEEVYGHYEAGLLDARYATTKTCPNIPMEHYRDYLLYKISTDELVAAIAEHNNPLSPPTEHG